MGINDKGRKKSCTLKELGELIGVTDMGKYERGERSANISHLVAISELMGFDFMEYGIQVCLDGKDELDILKDFFKRKKAYNVALYEANKKSKNNAGNIYFTYVNFVEEFDEFLEGITL